MTPIDGILGYSAAWPLAGDSLDASGHGNNGTLVNGPTTFVNGVPGPTMKAASLADNYTATPKMTFGLKSFSVVCSFLATSSTQTNYRDFGI